MLPQAVADCRLRVMRKADTKLIPGTNHPLSLIH
jgi:hypothetical protein